METSCTYVPYGKTNYFSNIVIDYINGSQQLAPFYRHAADIYGIEQAIEARRSFPQQRELLVEELNKQYDGLNQPAKLLENIQSLLLPDTFTVTTAHQPNIFTGPLYFIYKILHVISLADELNRRLPGYHFVPAYYIGSEDADIEELGNIVINGVVYSWPTKQTGAVGRMKVDKDFIGLMDAMHGQLGVLPYGEEIVQHFKQVYTVGKTIQQATLELVNDLFGAYGLVIVIPDNPNLKKLFQPVVEKELKEQFSHKTLHATFSQLEQHYKIQATGREVNLFYLLNDKRERIDVNGDKFQVESLKLEWTKETILNELSEHPERFSPNVILRGAFQETILPNVAFIGGGGELAYWLELKKVFESVQIPYPVLVLRNSFLLVEKRIQKMLDNLKLQAQDMFESDHALMTKIVDSRTEHRIRLNGGLTKVQDAYTEIMQLATSIDRTLHDHVAALKTKAVDRLLELEKKMLRAEKRKYDIELSQIQKIKFVLFPNGSLQERSENISGLYARYGKELIDILLQHSRAFTQEFGILHLPA